MARTLLLTAALLVFQAVGAGCGMRAAVTGQRLRTLQEVQAPALPAGDLDVLVWNIKKTEEPGWTTNFAKLVAGKELVILQEAVDTKTMRDGLAGVPHGVAMGVSFVYEHDSPPRATGVATGAIASPGSARVQHSPTREPFVPTPKAVLITTYPLEGQPHALMVVNIHAINFRRAAHLRRQLHQVEHAIEGHQGPVIFAGDFNTHHRPRFDVMEEMAGRLGLHTVFPNWTQEKRRRRRDLVDDGRMRFGKWPLDHVFIRGLEVVHAKVHGGHPGSDHLPLTLTVRVPATAARAATNARDVPVGR